MAENRRDKYKANINSNNNNSQAKFDIVFDITQLDLLCNYIVSNNMSIRRSNVINMRNVFKLLDMNQYSSDTKRLEMIDFINKGIEARIDYNITDGRMVLQHIYGGMGVAIDYDKYRQLNDSEVAWVNKTMSEIINYHDIYDNVDTGLDLLTKFKSLPYADKGTIVNDIKDWVNDIQVKFRRSRPDKENGIEFSLNEDMYVEAMSETYRHLNAPSNRLKFGTQALNILTGGGVEAQRVYTLLGLPGEGKSATLIDMAIQLKKYNANYVCKDPTKRPVILLLVMENSVEETVQRIFSMSLGQDMTNYPENDIYDALRLTGNLGITDENPIDIRIIYRSNLSIDTSYLYTMVDDLADEGCEVICVLQDYIKRIKSVEPRYNQDLRDQLGAVVNEFKAFAITKDIPVITASQLNRAATNSIDMARANNKKDLVRTLTRGNVGDSNLILENSDWIALIAPEYDENGKKYLGMQRVKSRYYIPGDTYEAYMPYIDGRIKLEEDFYLGRPSFRASMNNTENITNRSPLAQGTISEIRNFDQTDDIAFEKSSLENNIFLSGL